MQTPLFSATFNPAVGFGATIYSDSKIEDDVYDLIRATQKNELHVHQSGSSDIAFLKYALLRDIREGKINELAKVDAHNGTQTIYNLQELQGDELQNVLNELLEWENLREYFRFFIQAERNKEFIPSSAFNNGGIPHGLDIEDYFNHLRDFGLEAYRATSSKINPHVKNLPAAYLLAHLYALDVANENVRYAEYRVSPVGKNYATYNCTTEELINAVSEGFKDAQKRLAPSRKSLDYGLIILMERQGPTIVGDPKRFTAELYKLLETHNVEGRDELLKGWLRLDAVLQRAVEAVSKLPPGANRSALSTDLLTLFKRHKIPTKGMRPTQAPRTLLNQVTRMAADKEKEKSANALKLAQETVELRKKGYNITGIDLAGDELNNPSPEFAQAFKVIRDYNEDPATPADQRIGITIHAGETSRSGDLSGAEAVRAAIDLAWSPKTPVRIGHGIQLINSSPALKKAFEAYLRNPREWKNAVDIRRVVAESPLLKEVIEKGIILEMCPKSNLQTYGVHPGLAKGPDDGMDEKYSAKAYKKHPAVFLSRLGVKVAISTDNRTISNSDVTNEFVKLYKYAGLTYSDMKKMIMDGFEGAFVFDPAKKAQLLQEVQQKFLQLETNSGSLRAMQKMGKELKLYQRFILWKEPLVKWFQDMYALLQRKYKEWTGRTQPVSAG